MCSHLNNYQHKTGSYKLTYMNPVVTTNWKPIIDTQKLERNKWNYTAKEDYQTTREETEKKQKWTTKTIRRQ